MTISTKQRTATTATNKGRSATKKEQLIKLLGAKAGVDIKSLSEKLGWQQHTMRAALSGLRKAGYEVAGEKPVKGGLSKYRIVPAQEGATVAGAANGA